MRAIIGCKERVTVMIFEVFAERKDPSILSFAIRQEGQSLDRKPIATVTKMIRNVKVNMFGRTYEYVPAEVPTKKFDLTYPVEPQSGMARGYRILQRTGDEMSESQCYTAQAVTKKSLLKKTKFDFDVFTLGGTTYLCMKTGLGARSYYYCVLDAKKGQTIIMIEYINSNLDNRLARIILDDVTFAGEAFLIFAKCVVVPIPVDEEAKLADPSREKYVSSDEEKAYFDREFFREHC